MATVPAILLSLLLPAAEPLTPAELDLAVAALEESLTRYTAIEATYAVRYEFKPNPSRPAGMVPPPPATMTWIWKNSQEVLSTAWIDAPEMLDEELSFDGAKTYRRILAKPDSKDQDRILISPGPPGPMMMSMNYISFLTGVSLFASTENLLSLIDDPKESDQALSGTKTDGRWKISLGRAPANRVNYRYEVDLDATTDYRLASICWRELDSGQNSRPRQWEFVVDEFQSVLDEASGQQIWFPLKGRFEMPAQITYMEVASVRINHAVPSATFGGREPKFGTKVKEVTIPGGPIKRWTVGGEAAEMERMKDLLADAELERERVKASGISVNASPPSSDSRWWWAGGGCLLLVSAWVLSRYVNRRAR